MAQYKVPQDVEADDKLLGPFTFRQFIYLIVTAGMCALAWALFQIFPLLVIIPVPIILFFGALALPLKKDQPMETYFAALVSFYLKPRKRLWEAGQTESTIRITAPKKIEATRVKNLSQDEASHRLSFLAEIVDSEGHAIKGAASNSIKEEIHAEANSATDMFEASHSLDQVLKAETTERHEAAVTQMQTAIENDVLNYKLEQAKKAEEEERRKSTIDQMKSAIESANALNTSGATIKKFNEPVLPTIQSMPVISESVIEPIKPIEIEKPAEEKPVSIEAATAPEILESTEPAISSVVVLPTAPEELQPDPALVSLANDKDLSVETIAKEAHRLQQKQQQSSDDEIVISLR